MELGQLVVEKGITTDPKGELKLDLARRRRVSCVLETQDRFGKRVTALTVKVVNPLIPG